ncbi:MAG: hypothetical protein O2895_03055 [Chloroflexi bacterium]|nr:hypothetical protein [Chloroflexota bacterium]
MNSNIAAELEQERADLERLTRVPERVISLYERLSIAAADEHHPQHALTVQELPVVAEHVHSWKQTMERQELEIERLERRNPHDHGAHKD